MPVEYKIFDELLQHHEKHLQQQVGTEATSPRSIFAKTLSQVKADAGDELYVMAIMTMDRNVEFLVPQSDPETEATTWRITDTDRVVNQVQCGIYGVTTTQQMGFKMDLSICLNECNPWSMAIGVQKPR